MFFGVRFIRAASSQSARQCIGLDSNAETTNTGIGSTATVVNLGNLGTTPNTTNTKIKNIAAQLITISTNAINGYSLSATASSALINPATGFFFNSNITPADFPSAAHWFGIHPCGLNVLNATWIDGASQACNTYIGSSTQPICKYGWPSQTTAVTLASTSTGPIGNSVLAGGVGAGLTTVEYAAGVDASVPGGTYTTVITYVATPTF